MDTSLFFRWGLLGLLLVLGVDDLREDPHTYKAHSHEQQEGYFHGGSAHDKNVLCYRRLMRAKGVDVSRWKPVRDWKALKNSGVSFVGMKATEGNSIVDPTVRSARDSFRETGFLLGIYYHFARSGRADHQAERLIDSVRGGHGLQPNERLALDFEVMTTAMPEDGLAWVELFCKTIKAAYPDRRPIIYTSKRIWRMIGDPDWALAKEVDLWASRYNSQAIEPELPTPWKDLGWTFWQWSDGDFPSSVTPGVGKCDANFFRGTEAELAEYAKCRPLVA